MKDTIFYKKRQLNCGGKLLDLSTPKIMGIINCTPDSFYDGGKNNKESAWLKLAEKHLSDGATILDIGGQSTRPGFEKITPHEEINRILPVIQSIKKHFPECIISLDTFNSEVAKVGYNEGIHIINDISMGEYDTELLPFVLKNKISYVATHRQNIDEQTLPITSVYKHFTEIKTQLFSQGLNDLIIDPGFGFNKTLEQNFQILNHLEHLNSLGLPILIGISRKSMIFKTLKILPENALNGSTVLHTISLLKGADILRVHDVRESIECIQLLQQMNTNFGV